MPPNRREFLAQTALAGAILAAGGQVLAVADEKDAATSAPRDTELATSALRILILGGTGHIGPHHVSAAVNRGHNVSVFTRGKTPSELSSKVEILTGDRNGNLDSIENRDWDAVLDLATFGPAWVRRLGQALHGRVKHYTFISTVSVYENPISNINGTDENSKVLEYRSSADPYSATLPENQYGQLKVLCERESEKQFPGRTLLIRPGYIVGPGDALGAFTYLPVRMEAGGEVLAAGDPLSQVQMIDVRDMAEWIIRLIEMGATGTFNAVGPAMPIGWAELLGAVRGSLPAPLRLTWVPASWITNQKVQPMSNVLFWPMEVGTPGTMRMSNDKARIKGLTFRAISVTSADTLSWFKSQTLERRNQVLLGFNGTGSSLGDSMQREREMLAMWHTHQTKS
jgi:2'-hydroxyisoflavone reductase